jgi:Flp pilus assembly pilin Flp
VRRQAGQASVELIACALILALIAVAAVTALSAIRARIAAEQLADQAAVLVAEGRPLPAELRTHARIEVDGRSVEVTVPLAVSVPGLPAAATAGATVPR